MNLPGTLPMLGLEGITLKAGGHDSRAAGVCAMEAVAWLAGEKHSDQPSCACPVIASFMRNWNDNIKDDTTRTNLLRPLLPLLVGSRSTKAVELRRSYLALDWLARECAPTFLSLRDDLKAHAVALRGLKPLTDAKSCKAAQKTLDAARDAAGAAAWDAAWAAARDAAGDAARDAAWDAARDAARAAAGAAAGDAAMAAAWDAARDAAWAAAWDAAWDAAGDAAMAAARDAAWAAAWDAARDALAPTVTTLQASASDLVRRMVAIKEAS